MSTQCSAQLTESERIWQWGRVSSDLLDTSIGLQAVSKLLLHIECDVGCSTGGEHRVQYSTITTSAPLLDAVTYSDVVVERSNL